MVCVSESYFGNADENFRKGRDVMGTVIIGLIVAVVLFLAGRQLYKDKKNGKSLCGGKCSCCPNGSHCYNGNASHGEIKK